MNKFVAIKFLFSNTREIEKKIRNIIIGNLISFFNIGLVKFKSLKKIVMKIGINGIVIIK